MTFQEFCGDDQPWITLIYLVFFASRVVAAYFQADAGRSSQTSAEKT